MLDYRAVLGYIEDNFSDLLDVSANKARYKRLILRAQLTIITDNYLKLKRGVEVEVKNGIAMEPCDCVRFLRIYDQNDCEIYRNRSYAEKSIQTSIREGIAYMDYYGIPLQTVSVDGRKEQLPTVLDDHIEYLAHYVLCVELRTELLKGKIPMNYYQLMKQEKQGLRSKALGTAKSISIHEVEEALWALQNGHFYRKS
jgi:hypothetical protein